MKKLLLVIIIIISIISLRNGDTYDKCVNQLSNNRRNLAICSVGADCGGGSNECTGGVCICDKSGTNTLTGIDCGTSIETSTLYVSGTTLEFTEYSLPFYEKTTSPKGNEKVHKIATGLTMYFQLPNQFAYDFTIRVNSSKVAVAMGYAHPPGLLANKKWSSTPVNDTQIINICGTFGKIRGESETRCTEEDSELDATPTDFLISVSNPTDDEIKFTIRAIQSPCIYFECKNGGVCMNDGICDCPEATKGESCEQFVCDYDCNNHGSCNSSQLCSCDSKWDHDEHCLQYSPAENVNIPMRSYSIPSTGVYTVSETLGMGDQNLYEIKGSTISASTVILVELISEYGIPNPGYQTFILIEENVPFLFAKQDKVPSVSDYDYYDAEGWADNSKKQVLLLNDLVAGKDLYVSVKHLGIETISYHYKLTIQTLTKATTATPVELDNCNGFPFDIVSNPFCKCGSYHAGQFCQHNIDVEHLTVNQTYQYMNILTRLSYYMRRYEISGDLANTASWFRVIFELVGTTVLASAALMVSDESQPLQKDLNVSNSFTDFGDGSHVQEIYITPKSPMKLHVSLFSHTVDVSILFRLTIVPLTQKPSCEPGNICSRTGDCPKNQIYCRCMSGYIGARCASIDSSIINNAFIHNLLVSSESKIFFTNDLSTIPSESNFNDRFMISTKKISIKANNSIMIIMDAFPLTVTPSDNLTRSIPSDGAEISAEAWGQNQCALDLIISKRIPKSLYDLYSYIIGDVGERTIDFMGSSIGKIFITVFSHQDCDFHVYATLHRGSEINITSREIEDEEKNEIEEQSDPKVKKEIIIFFYVFTPAIAICVFVLIVFLGFKRMKTIAKISSVENNAPPGSSPSAD